MKLPADLMKQCAMIKRMSIPDIYNWARALYTQGYQEGYNDGGHEFDDAIIMTEEEAVERGLHL